MYRTPVSDYKKYPKLKTQKKEAQRFTYNFISGLGFPLTCSMKDEVDSFSISESFSFEMNTGWLDASRSWRSAADTEM